MIREENTSIREVTAYNYKPGIKLIIDADSQEHAENLRKQVLFCQRVESDLEDYIRMLGNTDVQRTQDTIETELTKLLENELFEEERDPDEDNH